MLNARSISQMLSLALLLLTSRCLADDAGTKTDIGELPSERARITYGETILQARAITANSRTHELNAQGDVQLTSPQGIFYADSARYSMENQAGELNNAHGTVSPLIFRAEHLTLDPQQGKRLTHGSLTTCIKAHPHYQFIARDVRLTPDNHYDARGIGLEMFGRRLFTLPRIRGEIGGGGDNIGPTYTAGVSRIDGLYVEGKFTYPLGETTDARTELRAGTQKEIRGGLFLERTLTLPKPFTGGKFTLLATRREDVLNRSLLQVNDDDSTLRKLTVSRTPAAQFELNPIRLPGPFNGVSVHAGGGFGRYSEQPTGTTENRSNLWGILRTTDYKVGPFNLHGEYGFRHTAYPNESLRTRFLQVSASSDPKADYFYEVSYLHTSQVGSSPFLFDRALVPDELFSEVELPVANKGTYHLGLWHRLNLDNGHTLDYNVTAIYHLDCISYGLYYNFESATVGVGMVINAFGSFHKRTPNIAFTQ